MNLVQVIVRNGNLEKALRVLKKKVQKEGITKEIKMRQFYTKPSEKRKKVKETLETIEKRQRADAKNLKKKIKKIKRRHHDGK